MQSTFVLPTVLSTVLLLGCGGGGGGTSSPATDQNPPPTTGIGLNKHTMSLVKGHSETLIARKASDVANTTINWKSNDLNIATVSTAGEVKGVSTGDTVITATTKDGLFSDSCSVSVTMDASVENPLNEYFRGSSWSYNHSYWEYYNAHIKHLYELSYHFNFLMDGTGYVVLAQTDNSMVYNVITDKWQTKVYQSSPTYYFNYSATSSTTMNLTNYSSTKGDTNANVRTLSRITTGSFYADELKLTFVKN